MEKTLIIPHIATQNHEKDYPVPKPLIDAYVLLLAFQRLGNASMTSGDLFSFLNEKHRLNMKGFCDFASSFFRKNEELMCLSSNQNKILSSCNRFEHYFNDESTKPVECLASVLDESTLSKYDSSIVCAAISIADKSISYWPKEVYEVLFFLHLLNKKDEILAFDDEKKAISPANQNIPLRFLFLKRNILKTITLTGICGVSDLFLLDSSIISDIFFLFTEEVIRSLSLLNSDVEEGLSGYVYSFLSLLEEKKKQAFTLRHGLKGGHEYTGLEISHKMHISAKEVETLLKSANDKLRYVGGDIISAGLSLLFLKRGEIKVISEEEALSYFDSKDAAEVFLTSIRTSSNPLIGYNKKFRLIYEKGRSSIAHYKRKCLTKIPKILSIEEFDKRSPLEKRFILDAYSYRDNGFFLPKRVMITFMYMSLIDRFFASGYHLYGEDYDDLVSIMKKEYGAKFLIPSRNAITTFIQDSQHYCLIDESLYKNRSRVKRIKPDLFAEIVSYINSNGPVVFFRSIFFEFKDELFLIGVKNFYFLKGLLTYPLRKLSYNCTADYVTVPGSEETGRGLIRLFLHSNPYIFSMQDIKNRFPNLSINTIKDVVYEEKDILSLGDEKFIDKKNLTLDDKWREAIFSELKKALEINDGVASSFKIYARLQLFHEGYEEGLKELNNATAIYSFLYSDATLRSLYDFQRPYISIKGQGAISSESLLLKRVMAKEEVTSAYCNEFHHKLGISPEKFSFVSFMRNLSDDFVIVSSSKAIKKKSFNMPESTLNEIRGSLLFSIRVEGSFKNEGEASFSKLPKMVGQYPMNEYLLLGIALSYLSSFFIADVSIYGKTLKYTISEEK